MVLVLSLLVPHISSFWCVDKFVLRDCGISWVLNRFFFYFFHADRPVPEKVQLKRTGSNCFPLRVDVLFRR